METMARRKQLTSEGAAGQLANDRGFIWRRDYAPQGFVGCKVNPHIWGHTHSGGYHATIKRSNAAFFPHDFEGHPQHCEVFGRPSGVLSRVE